MTFASDAAFMCSDVFSVPVVYGAQNTSGIVDIADHLVPDGNFGQTQIRATTLTIKTGSLTSLVDDSAITVDGRSYKLRLPSEIDDGLVTVLMIVEA